jgi:hypothetical protein
MPSLSHQTESLERLNSAFGLAKGTPLSERIASGKLRSRPWAKKQMTDTLKSVEEYARDALTMLKFAVESAKLLSATRNGI